MSVVGWRELQRYLGLCERAQKHLPALPHVLHWSRTRQKTGRQSWRKTAGGGETCKAHSG